MAAGVSASGKVRSTAGVTCAGLDRARASATRSAAFSDAMNVPSFWPTNGDSSHRPELAVDAAEPAAAGLAADDDERARRGEGAAERATAAVARRCRG